MGYINVQLSGSFVDHHDMTGHPQLFGAMDHGHADAVARAIQYLAEVVLPRATALDHELHADDAKPRGGFTPSRITRGGG